MKQQILDFLYANRTVIAAWIVRELHVWLPPVWKYVWTDGHGLHGFFRRLLDGAPISTATQTAGEVPKHATDPLPTVSAASPPQ